MASGLSRIRNDWDTRAREDVLYWVYNVHGRRSNDWRACYEVGREQAYRLTSAAFQHIGMDPQGKSLLDIGCGVGRLFQGFSDMGFARIQGVDISSEMVKQGQQECPVREAEFHLVGGESLSPIDSASVDYCFSYNVFAHFPEYRTFWEYMEEIARVLKPGGWLQIHFRGSSTVKQKFFRFLPESFRQPVRVSYRIASLQWLRGASIKVNPADSIHSETLELGRAIPPQHLAKELQRMGFDDIRIWPDSDYAQGRRFWVIARRVE